MNKAKQRGICILLAICMVFGVLTTGAVAGGPPTFTDVDAGQWYAGYVRAVSTEGIMLGTGGGQFSPAGQVTRAMVVQTLYRLAGAPPVSGDISAIDVDAGEWYYDAVKWAEQNDVVMGFADGTFRPSVSISREHLALVLYRFIDAFDRELDEIDSFDGFSDEHAIAIYALDAVNFLGEHGVFRGGTAGQFNPRGTTQRSELAAVLVRTFDIEIPPAPPTLNIQPLLFANFNDVRPLLGSLEFSEIVDARQIYFFDSGISVWVANGTVFDVMIAYDFAPSRTHVHFNGLNGNSTRAEVRNSLGAPDVDQYDDEFGWTYLYILPHADLFFFFDSGNRVETIFYKQNFVG